MMREIRYGVGAVLAGRREVPCLVMAAWPCFLQPVDYHACVCPYAATQTARGQRCSVESCEQAKEHGLRVVWKVAGEAGWVGLGECSWGFSARRKVFRKKKYGSELGLGCYTKELFLYSCPAGLGG